MVPGTGVIDLRTGFKLMCEVEGCDPEVVFRRMNVVTGDREYELPLQLRCRSMCVGDVIVDEKGRGLFCAPCGWEPVKVVV